MTDQNTALIIFRRAKTLANTARRYPHTREACHRYILLAIKWAAQRNFSSMVTMLQYKCTVVDRLVYICGFGIPFSKMRHGLRDVV